MQATSSSTLPLLVAHEQLPDTSLFIKCSKYLVRAGFTLYELYCNDPTQHAGWIKRWLEAVYRQKGQWDVHCREARAKVKTTIQSLLATTTMQAIAQAYYFGPNSVIDELGVLR